MLRIEKRCWNCSLAFALFMNSVRLELLKVGLSLDQGTLAAFLALSIFTISTLEMCFQRRRTSSCFLADIWDAKVVAA